MLERGQWPGLTCLFARLPVCCPPRSLPLNITGPASSPACRVIKHVEFAVFAHAMRAMTVHRESCGLGGTRDQTESSEFTLKLKRR